MPTSPFLSSPLTPTSFQAALRQQLRTQTVLQRLLIVFNALCGIALGIFVNKATGGAVNQTKSYWFMVVVLGAFVVGATFLIALQEQPLPEFLVEFDALQQKEQQSETEQQMLRDGYEATQRALGDNYETALLATKLSQFSLIALEKMRVSPPAEAAALKQLLEPWIEERAKLFGFSGNALYNIGVYYIDGQDRIVVKYRECDDRLKRKDRSLLRGEGYVGICFSTGETKFSQDAAASNTMREAAVRTEDATYYRSLIAEPLRSGGVTSGVLVVTSSEPNQFIETLHVPITRLMARLIEQAATCCVKE